VDICEKMRRRARFVLAEAPAAMVVRGWGWPAHSGAMVTTSLHPRSSSYPLSLHNAIGASSIRVFLSAHFRCCDVVSLWWKGVLASRRFFRLRT